MYLNNRVKPILPILIEELLRYQGQVRQSVWDFLFYSHFFIYIETTSYYPQVNFKIFFIQPPVANSNLHWSLLILVLHHMLILFFSSYTSP